VAFVARWRLLDGGDQRLLDGSVITVSGDPEVEWPD